MIESAVFHQMLAVTITSHTSAVHEFLLLSSSYLFNMQAIYNAFLSYASFDRH